MKKSFSETPILDTLRDYLSKSPIRLHVPFHNGIPNNNIFPKELYNLDISEVSGYDIEGEDNPIFQSEKITADFFGVKHSFYLTGGASIGLVASLISLNKFGKKVILARNVHKSVINGVVLSGLEPVWLDIDFLDEWGIFSKVNPDDLEKLLSGEKDIAGCVIVSPTYEGVVSDIKAIAEICHKKNIPLIVDEAHGAHLSLRGVRLWRTTKQSHSAICNGADLVIQSWHKSLGSLTQSGVLHLANEKFFTYSDIKRSLDLVSSTSPSFLLLLSLELTRKYISDTNGAFFNQLLTMATSLKEEMKKIKGIEIFNNDDPLKIYLKSKNISGIDFAYELYKKCSIEIESANDFGLLMLIGQEFNDKIKNKIICAINEIITGRDAINRVSTKKSKPHTKQFKINPRKAFMLGFKNKNNDCEINAPCPPGYAINIPGMNYESDD